MAEAQASSTPRQLTVQIDEREWQFQRLDDGSVHVAPDGTTEPFVISRGQWASIIASMSWAGEDRDRFEKAYRFHHGDDPHVAGSAD